MHPYLENKGNNKSHKLILRIFQIHTLLGILAAVIIFYLLRLIYNNALSNSMQPDFRLYMILRNISRLILFIWPVTGLIVVLYYNNLSSKYFKLSIEYNLAIERTL